MGENNTSTDDVAEAKITAALKRTIVMAKEPEPQSNLNAKTAAGATFRTVLAGFGGYLVGTGQMDAVTLDQLQEVLGALVTFATLGWSLWQKTRSIPKDAIKKKSS
jgi:hypothetical protein